jgi:hypothetical protein
MNNPYYMATQEHIADLHHHAERARLAAFARPQQRTASRWRHALRPRFESLRRTSRADQPATEPASTVS